MNIIEIVLLIIIVLLLVLIGNKINYECYINSNQYNGKEKLTAVLMNYNRPKNAKKIVKKLETYPDIDEIILINNKQETILNQDLFDENITKVIDGIAEHDTYGVRNRFIFGLLAKNDNLLILDDDILPSKGSASFLLNKLILQPTKIHGIYGRNINTYGSDSKNDRFKRIGFTKVEEDVEIVLTRCLVVKKDTVKKFEENAHLMHKFASNSPGATWNGEDLFLNLISLKYNKNKNKIYNLPHTNLDSHGAISASKDHAKYRIEFLKEASEKLDIN
jgi:hypothetical protein